MTHIFKRSALILGASMTLGLGSMAVAQDDAATAETMVDVTSDTVLATVNGEDITLGQVIVAQASLPAQYQQLPADVLFPGLVEQLIQQVVLSQQVEEVTKRTQLMLENEQRAMVASQALETLMADAVTEEALQEAYDAAYADWQPTTEWNASHILVETEEDALSVIEEVNGGADFATVAQEKSTGPSGPNGGELGWFGEGMMVAPFQDAVMNMEVGAISEPVQTQFGWHVIKLNDEREQPQPTLDEVREELSVQIQNNSVEQAVQTLMDDAEIERKDITGIDPSVLGDLSLLD